MSGYIAVDLDGTLAEYDGWQGPLHIGKPVPAMLERVKVWLEEGREVRIFTARVAHDDSGDCQHRIERWCKEHLGQVLPVTCRKDYDMIELYDDRAYRVEHNTGRVIGEELLEGFG